ncbi:Mur ligase family protein [Oceanithermus sp.]|uniref:bifunctional folylpolyglutamate synthase/dihydrofolate synthase n=1 Tax=Oceanithermus sp. TaxID=2268145 RepID=UPI00257FC0B3|nr:Mur ligase family protein [Oceanithermus sp.]
MYAEAVRWLSSQRRAGRERGTGRLSAAWARMGGALPGARFVHVVGTNGKGSVAAYLEQGFLAAGVRTGAFTSPHLVDPRERVRVNGVPVSPEALVRFVVRARKLDLDDPPAFFEWMLAFALERFAAEGVAWAALEAGVGGVSDATAFAAERVALTVLTNVGEDHLASFGSLEALARDKAEAVRPGLPVVTAARGRTLAILREVARNRGAPLFVYDSGNPLFTLPAPPALGGAFQRVNAALAAAALRLLGFEEAAVRAALERARLPGRFDRRVFRGRPVLLDGAHNPPAARALAAELPGRYRLVFGAQPHKAVDAMLELLAARADGVVLTWPLPAARGGHGYEPDPLAALARAAEAARAGEPVVVTGSLYLVGRLLGSGLLE